MNDQRPLSEEELAGRQSESGAGEVDDAPAEQPPDATPAVDRPGELPVGVNDSREGGDRVLTQAEIDALQASLRDG